MWTVGDGGVECCGGGGGGWEGGFVKGWGGGRGCKVCDYGGETRLGAL